MPFVRRARGLALTASAVLCLPAVTGVADAAAPPGRGYELVSPLDTNGIGIYNAPFEGFAQTGVVVASEDGDRVNYTAYGIFAGGGSNGVTGLNSYLAERGAAGWSTVSLQPPMTWAPPTSTGAANLRDVTPDLSYAVIASNQPLTPGVPDNLGGKNLFRRSTADGSYTLVSSLPAGGVEDLGSGQYGGMSDDGRHIVYYSTSQAGGPGLFEWADGATRLVAAGPPATLLQAWGEARFLRNRLISGDGSRIAYRATVGGRDDLFLQIDGTTSRNVSGSRRTPVASHASPTFHGLSRSGRTVWFSSKAPLTDDANTGAGNAGNDLYAYDVDADTLTDVSVSANIARGADVLGVVGLSEDGSTAYFVARNAIAGEGTDGGYNLYVARDGETRFVAELLADDMPNWDRAVGLTTATARVTPDGEQLVFVSRARLTGYDNRHAVTGTLQNEVFRFDAAAQPGDDLTCVSCKGSGERPTGASTIQASFTGSGGAVAAGKLPRNISDDGRRIFFDSADALLPEAKNGRLNVYLWEDGVLQLLSSGSGLGDARFGDASASGDDAFLTTAERLLPAGGGDAAALWGARIGGGFPVPPTTPGCSGDACQGDPSPAPPGTPPGSFTYVGRGNVEESPARATVRVASVSAAARRTFARTGRLTLKVTVSGAGKVTVTGTAKLSASGAATKVAGAARTATGAQTLRVPLRLSAKARRALANGRSLSVRLDVRHSGAAGLRRATLRLPGAARTAKRSVNSSTRNR